MEVVLRLTAAVAGLIVMCVLIAACGGGDDGGSTEGNGTGVVVATVTRAPNETPTVSATTSVESPTAAPEASPSTVPEDPTAEAPTEVASPEPEPTATPAPPANGGDLSGFIYPIAGGCLPQGDQLMPNAPREYRLGTHEGIDFYAVDNCTSIGLGTPAVAAKAGTVIRADHGYVDLNEATLNAILANPTTAESFDAFRGRQVWVDHGNGIVTRYCHLSGIVEGLSVGDTVAQGEIIAYVGESGTPGSVVAPGTEYHLHWEVRIGNSYLGAGQPPADVRALYLALFQ